MPIAFNINCRCCQKFMQTGDSYHCKECWMEFHDNGMNDFMTREQLERRSGVSGNANDSAEVRLQE